MMLNYVLIISSLFALTGCLKKKEADVEVIFFKATCKLQDVGSANLACIKYRNAYAFDPSSNCDLLETNYNASTSVYVFKQQECASANVTGICEVDDRRVYYYQTLFDTTQARAECIGFGGSPQ